MLIEMERRIHNCIFELWANPPVEYCVWIDGLIGSFDFDCGAACSYIYLSRVRNHAGGASRENAHPDGATAYLRTCTQLMILDSDGRI